MKRRRSCPPIQTGSAPSRGSGSHRGDLVGGALVSPVRALLPRSRGAPRRTRHRGRPRHPVPVGATLHTAAGRRRPAVSPRGRGPVVRRRDLREGRRPLALRVPSRRPVRAGHRRLRVQDATPRRHEVLRHRDRRSRRTRRGHHRQVPRWPSDPRAGARRAHDTTQYANNRVEADHGRLKARLRPMRGLQDGPDRQRDHPRPRLHAEPPTRTLRTRRRRPPGPAQRPRSANSHEWSDCRGPSAGSGRSQALPRHGRRKRNSACPIVFGHCSAASTRWLISPSVARGPSSPQRTAFVLRRPPARRRGRPSGGTRRSCW